MADKELSERVREADMADDGLDTGLGDEVADLERSLSRCNRGYRLVKQDRDDYIERGVELFGEVTALKQLVEEWKLRYDELVEMGA